jgi:hypothetical protein
MKPLSPKTRSSFAPDERRVRSLRLLAGGTRRAALLRTCARAAPLGAIRPRRVIRFLRPPYPNEVQWLSQPEGKSETCELLGFTHY